MRAAVIVLALLAVPAAAQPVASDAPPPPRGTMGLGAGLAFGTTADGGGYGRLELEADTVMSPPDPVGGLVGHVAGLELWKDGDDYSFAIPVGIVTGIRLPSVRATIGGGIDVFTLARIAGDTGAALYGPYGAANLRLDLLGVQLGAEVRVARRILLGAEDYTQFQLGGYVGWSWEQAKHLPPRGPY